MSASQQGEEKSTSEDSTTFKALIKMNENHQHTIVPHHVDQSSLRTSSKATTIIEVGEGTNQQQQQMHEVSSSSTESVDTACKSLEFLRSKYTLMRRELFDARSRIEELEENLVVSCVYAIDIDG